MEENVDKRNTVRENNKNRKHVLIFMFTKSLVYFYIPLYSHLFV